MLSLIARRLASLAFVLLGITLVTFLVAHAAPGDPVQVLMGNRHDPKLRTFLLHLYGLDQPVLAQYLLWLRGALHGDFGLSFQFIGRRVTDVIGLGLPVSVQLGGMALLLAAAVGVPLGTLMGLWRGRPAEVGLSGVTLLLYSVPSFVLAPLFIGLDEAAFAHGLPSLPTSGWGDPTQMVMPVLVLAAGITGYIARLTRASLVDVLGQDFMRTARAKGLPERIVLGRHALRNALLPVVTYLGPSIAALVTGQFVVETLFNVPGIGLETVNALFSRDYPVVVATTALLAATVVLMNLMTDLSYAVLDPRTRRQA